MEEWEQPGIVYIELEDPEYRAAAIAHFIRLGKCPPVGTSIGLSMRLQASEATPDQPGFELAKCEDRSEKIWASFTITRADIDAGIALINSQKIQFKAPKTSFLKR